MSNFSYTQSMGSTGMKNRWEMQKDALLHSQLKTAGDDIFYVEKPRQNLPKEIAHLGKKYFRFMDFIYIPVSTEKLSERQVIIVNTLRDDFFPKVPNPEVNRKVREKIKYVVNQTNVETILELGPGKSPLFQHQHQTFKAYYMADLNHEVVSENKRNGFECFHFGRDTELAISDTSVDLIVAVFVFQFHISSYQISELKRVLKENGAIVANVYRRKIDSRSQLQKEFCHAGFCFWVLPDHEKLCRNHEYWCLYKDKSSRNVNDLIRLLETTIYEK